MNTEALPLIKWNDGPIVVGAREQITSATFTRVCPGCGHPVVTCRDYPERVIVVCETCVDIVVGCP